MTLNSTALGAVEQWRAELRAGVGRQDPQRPSTWRYGLWDTTAKRFMFDPLYYAACLEAYAHEMDREGIPQVGESYRKQAAETLCQAVIDRGAA